MLVLASSTISRAVPKLAGDKVGERRAWSKRWSFDSRRHQPGKARTSTWPKLGTKNNEQNSGPFRSPLSLRAAASLSPSLSRAPSQSLALNFSLLSVSIETKKTNQLLPQAAATAPSAAVLSAAAAAPQARRRSLLFSGAAGAAAAAAALSAGLVSPSAALAAYGDAARVFGSRSVETTFLRYEGDGFTMSLPAKWSQPLREKPYPGTVAAFNDSGDTSNQIFVVARDAPGEAASVSSIPSDELLRQLTPLFGEQSFSGETRSEGGFRPNAVAAASLMDVSSFEKDGKAYVRYDVLTRTADGEEGGRHQLLTAAVGSSKEGKKTLFVQLVVVGDKRWYKAGGAAAARGTAESFTVA